MTDKSTMTVRLRLVTPEQRTEDVYVQVIMPRGFENAKLAAAWVEKMEYAECVPIRPW